MGITEFDEREYVRQQYRTQNNLNVRIRTHQIYGEPKTDFPEWVLERLSWRGDERVLDVGCGSGIYVDGGRARAATYLAGDLSLGMLQKLRQPGLLRVNLDAQMLPLPANTVDVILANHMLYHVPDQDAAVGEFARALRSGGHLLAATNSEENMAELKVLGHRALAQLGVQAEVVRPALYFTLESGRALLERHFAQVARHDLPGALVFPEPEPVIEYLASTRERFEEQLPPGRSWEDLVPVLDELLTAHVAEHGEYRVHKLTGVFVCLN